MRRIFRPAHTFEPATPVLPPSAVRSRRILRVRTPFVPQRPASSDTRIYFKTLRAAQMAAWEASGGDVLNSGPKAETFVSPRV
jgi:hypothetical protein